MGTDRGMDAAEKAVPSPSQSPETGPKSRHGSILSRDFVLGPVEVRYGDLVLLSHSMASGMIDAAAFVNWSVFAAIQTGNTIILGLSTATLTTNPHAWTTTLVSIASFLIGAFSTFRGTHYLLPAGVSSSRLWLTGLFMIQAVLIIVSAALVAGSVIPHNPSGVPELSTDPSVVDDVRIVGCLPLLSFQAGMQIACSRLMGFNELPVNVLTSTYCDLMGDNNLFSAANVKRNRRVAASLLLFAGAVIAGWLMRSDGGLTATLFTAGGIKFIAAVAAFIFFERKNSKTGS